VSRGWDTVAGFFIDAMGPGWTFLILLATGAFVGFAWHHYPWRTLFAAVGGLRRRRPAWQWRRRKTKVVHGETETAAVTGDDMLPDVPAETLASLADQLAAQGRFAEAVRERLRAIVRELVDTGVIAHRPAWTVTELARGAATVRPALAPPLDGAGRVFSDIWYGDRQARPEHDLAMRRYADDVHARLAPVEVAR
jgi:hypothetical protein